MSSEPPSPAIASLIARFRDRGPPPIARLIGFDVSRVAPDEATVVLDAGPQHANPMGTLHGGVLCDIADAAMGIAYATGLGPEESFTTIELKMNYLRPVWSDRLAAAGRVIKRGKRVGLLECRVTNERGDLVAYATSTCMTIPGTTGDGLTRPSAPG